MIHRLHLQDVGPAKDLDVRFAAGTNLITGDNGLGKTFLLDIAWWALSRSWAAAPALPATGASEASIEVELRAASGPHYHEFRWNPEAQEWPFERGRPPVPGLVLYARVDGGFAVWDPLRTADPSDSRRKTVSFVFEPEQVWNGLRIGENLACRGLIDDVVTWQLRSEGPYEQFTQALRRLSPEGDDLLLAARPGRVSLDDVRDIPLLRASYGDVPITHASAGVKRVVQLAYLLVWAWQEHQRAAEARGELPQRQVVMLIDEIEAHLHPRWQQQILPALRSVVDALADETQVQLIVATHSPLIPASLDPIFDPNHDAMMTLEMAEEGPQQGHPVIADEPWAPRSDAQAWLNSEAFEHVSGRPPQVHSLIACFERAMDADDADGARAAYWRLASLVASDDEDLIRLRAVLRQRGWYQVRFADGPET